MREFDNAIADYSEAIKLKPQGAVRVRLPRWALVEQEAIRQGNRRLQSGR